MEMHGSYGIFEGEIDPLLRRIRHHDELAAVEATPCPCCGAGLRVLFWPDGRAFQLLCSARPAHMSTLQSIESPPPWWAERVIEPVEAIVSYFADAPEAGA
jgi:hypothetical protein